MQQSDSIGAIGVSKMIWTSTFLTLGSLGLCWFTTKVPNPTIMQSAKEYPYTIIFRVGMMYSLFITFLQLFFIKWWLDNFPISKSTTKMVVLGTIGLASYGLFVSCIDRKRINYQLAELGVTISAITTSLAIYIIMKNLKKNRQMNVLTNQRSWFYKRLFSIIHFVGISLGLLIYTGYLDRSYKQLVQYTTVISTSLFFWSFSIDFKKFKMDVERIVKPQEIMVIQA